jgi:hypothetical protein
LLSQREKRKIVTVRTAVIRAVAVMSDSPEIVALGLLVGLPTGIITWFNTIDKHLTEQGRKAIGNWLRNLSAHVDTAAWPKIYSDLIDKLFGPRVLSLRFFLRSCLASVISFVFVIASYASLTKTPLPEILEAREFLLLAIVNIIPDYCSLLISRKIVLKIATPRSANPHKNRLSVLLLFDGLLKAMTATAATYLVAVFVHAVYMRDPTPWLNARESIKSFYHDGFCSSNGTPYGLYFYGSFLSSSWIWLYLLGGVLTKAILKKNRAWASLGNLIEIHPLQVVGFVAAATVETLVLIAFAIIAFVGR